MLVLSRRKNESIVIGDAIRVIVVEIRSDRVRLGIDAPRDCPTRRWEPHEPPQPLDATPLRLSQRQAQFVDRLTDRLNASSPLPSVTRQDVVRTLIDGVEERNLDVDRLQTLADLRAAVSGRGRA